MISCLSKVSLGFVLLPQLTLHQLGEVQSLSVDLATVLEHLPDRSSTPIRAYDGAHSARGAAQEVPVGEEATVGRLPTSEDV